jgi:hypothetical protein
MVWNPHESYPSRSIFKESCVTAVRAEHRIKQE